MMPKRSICQVCALIQIYNVFSLSTSMHYASFEFRQRRSNILTQTTRVHRCPRFVVGRCRGPAQAYDGPKIDLCVNWVVLVWIADRLSIPLVFENNHG